MTRNELLTEIKRLAEEAERSKHMHIAGILYSTIVAIIAGDERTLHIVTADYSQKAMAKYDN